MIAADEYAIASAFEIRLTESGCGPGLALGHACLSFSADADPPAITRTLVAEHDPCLLFTKDGYEAAVSAFPGAMRVTCREKPSVSMTFAEAMRDFYREVVS